MIRFLHAIDRGLLAFLKDEQAPLVFAGVDYLFSFYCEITSLPNLLEKNISGNPDGLRLDELGKQSWVIAQAFYKKTQDEALAQYWQSVGTGFASTNIAEIIPAAYNGRMGILFSAAGCRQWGKFRPEGNEVILLGKEESRSEDLCDFAAMHTFLNKGLVYEMQPQEMPEGQSWLLCIRGRRQRKKVLLSFNLFNALYPNRVGGSGKKDSGEEAAAPDIFLILLHEKVRFFVEKNQASHDG